MAAVRLQDLLAGVVVQRFTGQRVGDVLGHVEVTDAPRVRRRRGRAAEPRLMSTGPTPGKLRSARSACCGPNRPRSVPVPRPGPRYAPGSGCVVVPRRPPGIANSAPAPTTSGVGGRHMPYAADSGSAAGPGAGSPNSRTRIRHARKASFPVTTCSMQAGASASNTASVRPIRKCPNRRSASTSGPCSGKRPEAARIVGSPTSLGSWSSAHSAPSPQARAATSLPVADDLDQGRSRRRAGRAQPHLTESAVGRISRAPAQQVEGRLEQHRMVQLELPGLIGHGLSGPRKGPGVRPAAVEVLRLLHHDRGAPALAVTLVCW